jgi:hypothetical protein
MFPVASIQQADEVKPTVLVQNQFSEYLERRAQREEERSTPLRPPIRSADALAGVISTRTSHRKSPLIVSPQAQKLNAGTGTPSDPANTVTSGYLDRQFQARQE